MDEKEILFKILTIIGYKDNKMQFIETFFAYIYTEAIAEIGTSISKEKQIELSKELESTDDEELQKEMVLRYISKKEFDELLTLLTKTQLSNYLDAVYPTIPVEKQEELITFLTTLNKP